MAKIVILPTYMGRFPKEKLVSPKKKFIMPAGPGPGVKGDTCNLCFGKNSNTFPVYCLTHETGSKSDKDWETQSYPCTYIVQLTENSQADVCYHKAFTL